MTGRVVIASGSGGSFHLDGEQKGPGLAEVIVGVQQLHVLRYHVDPQALCKELTKSIVGPPPLLTVTTSELGSPGINGCDFHSFRVINEHNTVRFLIPSFIFYAGIFPCNISLLLLAVRQFYALGYGCQFLIFFLSRLISIEDQTTTT